jgi:hypothetical protein
MVRRHSPQVLDKVSQRHKHIFRTRFLDTYLRNVEQNDSRKIYRAKTPSTPRKIITYFSEPWRPLRLCARHVFPISSSSEHFKYLWLDSYLRNVGQYDCKTIYRAKHAKLAKAPPLARFLSKSFLASFAFFARDVVLSEVRFIPKFQICLARF